MAASNGGSAAAAAAGGSAAAAAGAEGDEPQKASWWRRAVNKLTGKGPNVEAALAAAAASVDGKLAAIADELDRRADVSDRRTLLQRPAGRPRRRRSRRRHACSAMIAALRQTNAVSGLPCDHELSTLLRRACSVDR